MYKYSICLLFILIASCSDTKKGTKEVGDSILNHADLNPLISKRLSFMLDYKLDSLNFPRSMNKDGSVRGVSSQDWTSGFFPGVFFKLYQITEQLVFLEKGKEWVAFMEKEKFDGETHDMGFKIHCSYGELFKITGAPEYKDILLTSAETLSKRFDPKVGSIRSWDFGEWQFPVIIDNMMNLELLFEATKLTGDSTYHQIAETHAHTTMKNHFRDDFSSYHVVDYDKMTGEVLQQVTHQGINDSSVWSRGQAWGFYGFVMTYRYTQNEKFLNQAVSMIDFIKKQPSWPEDDIPFWDMRDPRIPNAPRDASAAAITASACFELYAYTENEEYLSFANDIMTTLLSEKYVLNPQVAALFILDHSTGDWSKQMELDVPIGYSDYYFLEAIKRQGEVQ